MASLKRIENLRANSFGLVYQQPRSRLMLIVDALNMPSNIARTPKQKTAGACPDLGFQALPAGEVPVVHKTLEPREELVYDLIVGRRHVHQPRCGEIVQRPQSADRENDAGLARVVGASSRGRLAGFVAKQDSTLPIVKRFEPKPVREIQNGD